MNTYYSISSVLILRWLEEKVPAWLGVPVRGALLPVGTVAVKAAISNIFGIRHGGSEPILCVTQRL